VPRWIEYSDNLQRVARELIVAEDDIHDADPSVDREVPSSRLAERRSDNRRMIWSQGITSGVAVLALLISAFAPGYVISQQKIQDYERQDKVAEVLRIENEKKALAVALIAKTTDGKLDTIHELVNSNYTLALQNELDSRSAELIALLEISELKKAAGKAPSAEAVDRIAITRKRIDELQKTLAIRAAEQKIIDEKARKQ
jgi:hypothetical protein